MSWWDVYQCEDVNTSVEILSNKLTKLLDEMAPIKSIQIRAKYAPWLSANTKELMRERNWAQQVAGESGLKSDWDKYKHLRNSVTNRLRIEKKHWHRDKLAEYSEDSRATWGHIKRWLGWSSGGPPSKLISNGVLCNKPLKIITL